MKSTRGEEELLDGAVYASLKTQAHSLHRMSRYKDALNVYNDALFLNPRSKTILLDKSQCFLQMGEPEKALKEVDGVFPNSTYKQKNQPDSWRAGVHRSSRPPPDNTDVPEALTDLSYKCRFLLNKADALYNKGDFENALMYYHKGHRLRPKAQEFRLGIIKSEDALKVLFTKKEQEKRKQESRKTVVRFAKPSELVKEIKEKKEEKEPSKPKEEEKKESDTDDKTREGETKAEEAKTNGTTGEGEESKKEEKEEEDEEMNKEIKDDKKKASDKKTETKDDQKMKQDKPPTEHIPLEEIYSDKIKKEEERKDRIKEARLAFGVKERQEARKIRAKYHSRPNGHLKDDIKFLKMMYRTMGETELKNKKVKKMTKDALNYLDSRNSFWEQQTPHHIREKSLILPNRDNGQKPPPTQAMYAFMVKEMMRINTMMEKSQWYRSIETAKKLIEHIGNMSRRVPDKENVMTNCFSMIGNCYLELGQEKKSLAFHMKDLEMATKCDLDEAKLRALDNVGRVYARIGEFHKAIAIWEEKMSSPFPTKPGERAWLYHEMGYCCIEVDDPEKAKECGLKSYEAAVEKEDKKWQLNAKILLSQAMLRCGEAFEAKDEFQKALELAKEIGDAEAQKKTEDALKELEEVLAEWDYMASEAEDSFEEDSDEHDQAVEPAKRVTSASKSLGGDSIHTNTSWSTTKKANQADWLLAEEEQQEPEQQAGCLDNNEGKTTSAKHAEDSSTTGKPQTSVKGLPPKPKKPSDGSTTGSQKKTAVPHPKTSTSSTKGSVVQKPKREKSNASLTHKPAKRENSNASLSGRKSRESSFTKPPKRELSNQSLNKAGKISREPSNASLKTKKQTPQKVEEPTKPAVNRMENTAAIYLDKGTKPLSREASNVSRRSMSKQPKTEPNKDGKTQKPSAEEQRINRHAIDTVAATNDPEKSTLGMEEPDAAPNGTDTDKQTPPRETSMVAKSNDKAFITENTTMTSSTAQPHD